MRIIQLLPTLAYGDGVGNDTLALDRLLKEKGYDTCIYAENIDRRISPKLARPVSSLPGLNSEDVILYHLSTGTALNRQLPKLGGRKLIIYHNVTPSQWFTPYSRAAELLCKDGREGVRALAETAEYCLADSAYNKEELLQFGYRCEIDVLPILIPFEDYKQAPDENTLRRFREDGCTNLVFTGRIAPNKRQEDVIQAFACYQKYYNEKSRLFLVGSYGGMENYYERLKAYTDQLGVKNVVFTGHVKFSEILAYYHLADVFLCMSEHEGFCIPLVEAMFFRIPIVAFLNTGITGTLGGAGVGMREKDPVLTAGVVDRVVRDREFREYLLEKQKRRLEDFDNKKVEQEFIRHLERFIRAGGN